MNGEWCKDCETEVPVVDEFDAEIGFEEHAREVRVTALDCGHEIVKEVRR